MENTIILNEENKKIQIPEIIIPTNRKLRILSDQDDVIVQFNEHLVEIINEVHGTNYTIEDIKDWNITKLFNLEHNIEYYIEYDKDFFFNLKPKSNNLEVFEELYKSEKYDLFIVTYVNMEYPKFWIDKLRWIKKYMPYFPIEKVIATRHKNAVWGDYLIDDGPHNISEFNLGQGIIYDMPYNRNMSGKRVYNLEQFKNEYL